MTDMFGAQQIAASGEVVTGRRFRITVVAACPFPARRGTPIRVERLTDAFQALGNDVELVTYHIGEADYPMDFPIHRTFGRLDKGTLTPGPKPAKLLWYDPSLVRLLRRRLRERTPEVIYAHHFEGLLVALAARGRRPIPIIYDAHTMLASELPTYQSGPLKAASRRLGSYLDRAIPARAEHVVTVTEDIRSALIERHGFDPNGVSVAMNGVEVEAFTPIVRNAVEPYTVVYTGTLSQYQGFDDLLKSVFIAIRTCPQLRLKVYTNADFGPLGRQAEALGIRGAIDVEPDTFEDLPNRLARGAIAVLPRSVCDGIPQKLLNYMAAGMPIVAYRGSAKVLEHEKTGLIVENGDLEGFAQSMLRLVEDPVASEKLGVKARSKVLGSMNWQTAASTCQAIFERLVPK
ncbi:glycosyltransferase family 4 protein [Tropicimonas isoalkanivorans]|uniref:Glycosyltransferase involved in cell wall bisynthesis n=1 Tax=Tropicimonas isoalkanivorans TaxID=441112 RepID=A0A1I1QLQ2_9RHOB|nr:glycosyltransferase family 4 protein [Tropicimonas isoalkanivorans]SFD19010.1 Glycosyltransferase involved in cell wall bisynthesis [Tropicimonas isoalkanivorans]